MSILFDKSVTNGHQFHPCMKTLPASARPAIEMYMADFKLGMRI